MADVTEADQSRHSAHDSRNSAGDALAVTCDVRWERGRTARPQRGDRNLRAADFAFNNAGIEYDIKPVADVTEEEWDRIIDIDLRGVFLCMKHEIPLMLEQGGGAIVNTSSGAGIRGFKGGGAMSRRSTASLA